MKLSIFWCLSGLYFSFGLWNPFTRFLSKKNPIFSPVLHFFSREKKEEMKEKYPNFSLEKIPIKTKTPEKKKAWYIIGKSSEFEVDKLYPVVLQEKKYVVWKDSAFRFYALENQCSHKGAALSDGIIDQGCIVCPYHFSYFSKDGSLILGNTILKENREESSSDNVRKNTSISSFSVLSQNNWIYLNPDPDPDPDPNLLIPIYNTSTSTFQETELETEYQCSSEIIAEKMLDIVHYYQDPNPGPNDLIILQQPRWISSKKTNRLEPPSGGLFLRLEPPDGSLFLRLEYEKFHGQTIYQFRSGIRPISENIFVKKAGRTFFTVESEFVLPYTFITKIQTGDYTLKIISCISPISKKNCRVYTKIHRNFGKNWLGEYMVRSFIHTFLEKDREMLEKIDIDSWKQKAERKSRYYYRQEKMIRFYRQTFDAFFG